MLEVKIEFRELTKANPACVLIWLLAIEAEGSYEKAKAILDKYSLIRPEMKGALDRLLEVPVDIEPIFPLAK